MHWADGYVGLPFKARGRARDGLDCWGLVRLVWAELRRFEMPSFDETDDIASTIKTEANAFENIEIKDAKEFDAAIMLENVKVRSGWVMAPIHIGIVVDPLLVLHIRRGHLSCIEPLKNHHVHSVRRII